MVASSTSFSPLLPQSESELASSGLILVDSLASANNLSLADLNAAPESHQEALDQLKIAKKYIRCVQAQSRTGGYGTKLGLGHVSSDLEDQTTLTVAAQQRSDETDEAAAPGHSAEMTPYTYFHTPWWRLLLKRLPWLISLLLLQSFGALILDSYNKLISKHLVLNFFIPMMQGTSGNAGNQVRKKQQHVRAQANRLESKSPCPLAHCSSLLVSLLLPHPTPFLSSSPV